MSCNCRKNPCACQPGPTPQCPPPGPTTRCDRYRKGDTNVWVEKGPNPEDQDAIGVCMLDSMCDSQIIYVIEHDEAAREDLLRVTSDPHLLELAKTIPRLPVVEEIDAEQAQYNRTNEPASNPFYAVFRGQPPFAQ